MFWRTLVIPAPLKDALCASAGVSAGQQMRAPRRHAIGPHSAVALAGRKRSRTRLRRHDSPGNCQAAAGHVLNWLPGRSPYISPEGLSWPFEKGADFVVQLHMPTTGKREVVQPAIGLYFTDQPPTNQPFVFSLVVRTIDIPAGASDYQIRDSYKLRGCRRVLDQSTCALSGQGTERIRPLPDGTQKWLVFIKQWDFNWQGDYSLSRAGIFAERE